MDTILFRREDDIAEKHIVKVCFSINTEKRKIGENNVG